MHKTVIWRTQVNTLRPRIDAFEHEIHGLLRILVSNDHTTDSSSEHDVIRVRAPHHVLPTTNSYTRRHQAKVTETVYMQWALSSAEINGIRARWTRGHHQTSAEDAGVWRQQDGKMSRLVWPSSSFTRGVWWDNTVTRWCSAAAQWREMWRQSAGCLR